MRCIDFMFRVACVQLLWLPFLMMGCAEKHQTAKSPVVEAIETPESCQTCETSQGEMATEPGPFGNLPLEPLAAELPADPVQELQALVHQGRSDEVLRRLAKLDLPAAKALSILRQMQSGPFNAPDSKFDRDAGLKAIMQYGSEAVPTLLDVVASNDSNLRFSFTLYAVEPGLIAPLVAALDDEDVKDRRAAAWLLTTQNAAQHPNFLNQEQLATVLKRLEDEDGFVREYVLELLERFPPQSPEVIPTLVTGLTDEHGSNLHRAARILAQLSPQSLPAVRRAATSENPRLRLGAAVALGSMKPIPASEIPLLILLTRDPEADVRRYAVYGLPHSASAIAEVVQALTVALDDSETAAWAARALGEVGPPAASALPHLERQLKSAVPTDRVMLATAIWRIDAASPVVLPTLTEVLKDTQTIRGGYSAHTKMVEGKRIEVTAPSKASIASSAAEALGNMGPAAAPAVPALLKAAASENRELAVDAIRALGKIGPSARDAVPFLSTLAASQGPLSDWADYALREIAPEAAKGNPRIGKAVPISKRSSDGAVTPSPTIPAP
jgi:HEAT repeat protein